MDAPPPSRTQPATSYQIWLLSFFRVAVEPPASDENCSTNTPDPWCAQCTSLMLTPPLEE